MPGTGVVSDQPRDVTTACASSNATAMVAKLQHDNAGIRTKAVQLLTNKPGKEVSEGLTRALEDKAAAVRKALNAWGLA